LRYGYLTFEISIVCKISNTEATLAQNLFDSITPIVIGISGAVGAIIAFSSIKSAQALARKKATLDFLKYSNTNDDVSKGRAAFRIISKLTDEEIARYGDIGATIDEVKSAQISSYLNHYAYRTGYCPPRGC